MNPYEQLDQTRRWQGTVMDALGLGPEVTPSRTVLLGPFFTVKAYGDGQGDGPALLIVPAPIKAGYIWDLAPEVSVVQACLRHSVRVSLVEWARPGPGDEALGLDEYADTAIVSSLDAVEKETGAHRVFLAGHSLGGTFAAIFASLHPRRVKGLVLVGAPIGFGSPEGALDALVAGAPPAGESAGLTGNVPGSFLSASSILASYRSFQVDRMEDFLGSLMDVRSLQRHFMVERWTLDEMPLPKKLFEEVVEGLYRRNLFMRGELEVGGRTAAPASVDSPLLSVADERSDVVPPGSSLAFHEAVKSTDKRVLWYGGDVGVAIQHMGMLAGRNAHRFLWPEIMAWIHARGGG